MGGKTVRLLYGHQDPIEAIIVDDTSNIPHSWIFSDWRYAVHFLRNVYVRRATVSDHEYDLWEASNFIENNDDDGDDFNFIGDLNANSDIEINVMGTWIGDADLNVRELHQTLKLGSEADTDVLL